MPKKKTDSSEVQEEVLQENSGEFQEALSETSVDATEMTEDTMADIAANEENPPPKTKRSRKAQEETEVPSAIADVESETEEPETEDNTKSDPSPRLSDRKQNKILTLEAGADVETEESMADIIWHEIRNAYRTRRVLTGILGGLEQTDNGKTIAIVEYKGYRIVIPLKEMVFDYQNDLSGDEYDAMIVRWHKLLSKMLGAEIDFIVKGIDSKTRSVVASRKDAMLKKRKIFYMDTNEDGEYRIYEGRIIQARVIATAEKAIRIEAFGVECSILARDLAWEWIGDARDHYAVGDQILVRVRSVNREDIENITITADVRSLSEARQNNLSLCRVQSKYAGKITDVYKGIVYIRLTNGINAIAHSCLDRRMPGKKDDVSFVVTSIDEEHGVARGIITRIIKQNL